ncbi:MAG: hypothetical protein M1608_10495, partial [Candidatus Omnitrophica bacterium]|nr:hypothetical protein [Candidatus Omnitrophota bacterium]
VWPEGNVLAIHTANTTNPAPVELELRLDGKLVETRPLTIRPKETVPQVFAISQTRNGIFTLHLTANDDLTVDNDAAIVSLLPPPVKVLLVSRGNRFLEKALSAVSTVQLSTTALLTDSAAAFDLVVLDDITPLVWPEGNVLAIHTANTNWFDGWSRLEAPAIVDWKNTHPLLRFVSFDNVQVAESMAVKVPPWAVPLVESQQAPLILAGEWKRQRIVWIGFDLLQSTWPLRVAFPIFIANAVDWLNPASAKASQFMVRAGEPFRFAFAQPITNQPVSVELPNGTVKTTPINPGTPEWVFGATDKQGIYKVRFGTNELAFGVNLLDAAESDTTPRAELQLGKYAKVQATRLRRANLELWRWIAVAGLIVLLFEWWYYHKRTA